LVFADCHRRITFSIKTSRHFSNRALHSLQFAQDDFSDSLGRDKTLISAADDRFLLAKWDISTRKRALVTRQLSDAGRD